MSESEINHTERLILVHFDLESSSNDNILRQKQTFSSKRMSLNRFGDRIQSVRLILVAIIIINILVCNGKLKLSIANQNVDDDESN